MDEEMTQIQHIGYRLGKLYSVVNYSHRYMDLPEEASRRLKAIEFWDKHGLDACLDAFNVSRRTLFSWKKLYKQNGTHGLIPKSTAPKHTQKRSWPISIINKIRAFRKQLPNLGKEQVYVKLKPWCDNRGLDCPSVSTIGRLIADAHDKMRVSPANLNSKGKVKKRRVSTKVRRPKKYRPEAIGELIGVDAIERRMGEMRRYILTYIDEASDFAVAMAVPAITAEIAKTFFEKAIRLSPFAVQQVISDNGSEFHGEFDQLLNEADIRHLWTYPRTPKMNAVCERFNRTIQEQFVDYHEHLLFEDMTAFNEKLADYLVLYNAERPHKGLGLKTPVEVIIEQNEKCRMWWTHTFYCLQGKEALQ